MNILNSIKKKFSKKNKKENKDDFNEESYKSQYEGKDNESILDISCARIMDITRKIEELKEEYSIVTSYFSDVQKIEQLPVNVRVPLDDTARKLQFLQLDRTKLVNSENRITEMQYRMFQKYENEIPKIVERMKACEEEASLIRDDMQKLEGEKAALEYDLEELQEHQTRLRNFTMLLGGLLTVSLLIFTWLTLSFRYDMDIFYIIALMLGVVLIAYSFVMYRRYEYDNKLTGRKIGRAVTLINKVKIKYVNNTSNMDFMYNKYDVNSSKELSYLWEQYVLMLEEEKRYKRNTGDIEYYANQMTTVLRRQNLYDPNIWLKQIEAIVDNKEMVEVKHSLSVRRQKLREQLENYDRERKESIGILRNILTENPSLMSHVKATLATYNIDFE